jgi:hypothetical protein
MPGLFYQVYMVKIALTWIADYFATLRGPAFAGMTVQYFSYLTV